MSTPGYSGSARPDINVAPTTASAGAASGVMTPGVNIAPALGSAGTASGVVNPTARLGAGPGSAGVASGAFNPVVNVAPSIGSAGSALGLVKPGSFPRPSPPTAGQALGIVQAAAQLGFDAIIVRPRRSLGPFVAQVTIREEHIDEIEITEHPVEVGAAITDYAYQRPAELILECGWSNSPSSPGLINGVVGGVRATIDGITQTVQSAITGNNISQVRDLYSKLLALMGSRVPFDVYTGKRVYSNMLFKSLRTESSDKTEHSLVIKAHLRQLIVVSTTTTLVSVPRANQSLPGTTTPVINNGQKALIQSGRFTPPIPAVP